MKISLLTLSYALAGVAAQAAPPVGVEGNVKAFAFDLSALSLLPGRFNDNQNRTIAYLRAVDNNRMLYVFRANHKLSTAHYFKIPGLQDYALQRQQEHLQGQWTSADLVDCIREVYGTTEGDEDEMRNLISGVAYQHLAQLWNDEAFRQLIHKGGEFVVDMIGRSASGVSRPLG